MNQVRPCVCFPRAGMSGSALGARTIASVRSVVQLLRDGNYLNRRRWGPRYTRRKSDNFSLRLHGTLEGDYCGSSRIKYSADKRNSRHQTNGCPAGERTWSGTIHIQDLRYAIRSLSQLTKCSLSKCDAAI